MERLNPLNDYLFQKLFGEAGDEEQLISLLSAVLIRTGKNNISSIEILENKTFTAEIIGDKASILDLRAVLMDGTKVNIEVQLRVNRSMDKRSLFYWSREYTNGLDAGQLYSNLPNVIAINILNFEFFQGIDDFHTSFHLWEDNHKNFLLTDALELHFLDMVKFRNLSNKDVTNNSLHRWLTFLDPNASDTVLKEVISMDTAIQKTNQKMTFLSSDKETLRNYHMRELAAIDYASNIDDARKEGKEEGKIEGRIEGIAEGKQIAEKELFERFASAMGKSISEVKLFIDKGSIK